MLKKVSVALLGVVLVILIYQLPRVVVENETESDLANHSFEISLEDRTAMASFRSGLTGTSEIKKSVNFADSLGKLFLKYRMLDSVTYYADIVERDSSRSSQMKAAMLYYKAFQMTSSPEDAQDLGKKARKRIEKLLVDDGQDLTLRNQLAMTLIATENPMAGVQALRGILEDDPKNREALFNLGVLAIRSGQYDRAVGRFEGLVASDSTDYESMFYLAVSLAETGDKDEASRFLNKIIDSDADAALKATVAEYQNELL